ncbi:hypothetical protein ABT010_13270 [Streptomyces sp. NPDC002668]|uniref:hypothetical protein n=1 Tax=Streptomyces sp. NPDC002668 TaxID=3154422 RepID=UPI003317CA54
MTPAEELRAAVAIVRDGADLTDRSLNAPHWVARWLTREADKPIPSGLALAYARARLTAAKAASR